MIDNIRYGHLLLREENMRQNQLLQPIVERGEHDRQNQLWPPIVEGGEHDRQR
jgi:hypothetical protein